MVKIRMKRMGSKKRPFYRVVVADSRAPRDGRFIEELGYYNPIDKNKTFSINAERVAYWLGTGAQPSETVEKLLKKNGILKGRTVIIPDEQKEVEEKEEAVKLEESVHEDKVDAEQIVEDQKESDVAPAGTGDPVDPEEAAEKADFPVSDPTTEEVVEQEGDKVDAEEIVEENEKH
ncbi:MAG: 30S ribosomal protein S16 [Tissierellia bacterium]|nr:30S ribosomal protein S16 [Tissierellia bacterium]